MPHVSTLALAALLMLVSACGGARTPSPSVSPTSSDVSDGRDTATPVTAADVPDATAGQLARFAPLKLMVLPAQSLAADDPLGWRAAVGGDTPMLAALDAGIEAAMGERGLASLWIFPPALQRSARRNPTYVTDPAAMRPLEAIRAALRKPSDPISEPFASQLRTLAGVSDSRYALVPLELRFAPPPDGATGSARAILRAAVVDSRGAQVVWVGTVSGDPSATFHAGVLASLARRVADLVVPR